MRKTVVCISLIFLIIPSILNAQETKLPRIAVVAFSINDGRNTKLVNDAIGIRNQVQSNIVKTGQYDVIARDEIDKLMENQKIQASQISSAENIKKLKLLNISYIVTGTVDAMDSDYIVSISMLDVSNGKFTYSDEEFMSNASSSVYKGTKSLTERFMEKLGGNGESVRFETKKDYKIGDPGPGGGIIFYVSEVGFYVYEADDTMKKCNYMECSGVISSSSWCSRISGEDCCNPSTQTGIGYGKMNTSKIINTNHRGGSINASNCAAMLCYKYQTPVTKQGDWWLPSKDELNLVYTNLKCKGYISDSSYFWSSSSCDSNTAWRQNFSSGYQRYLDKYFHDSVRAVRAF